MPEKGIGRYSYSAPSQIRFDYKLSRPGVDTSWRTQTEPWPGMSFLPPIITLAEVRSMDRPGARLIDYQDSCVLMLPDSAGRLFYGIDKTRWVVVRKGRCTLRGDTCASPPVNVFYYYQTIKEIHVPVTILAYDSADTAKFHQYNGYYRFSNVRVNESLPDSVFGPGSAVLSGSGRCIPLGTNGLGATVTVDPAGRFIRNISGRPRGGWRSSAVAGLRLRVPVFVGGVITRRNRP